MRIESLRSIYRVNVRVVAALCFLCALLAAGWVAWRVASWVPHLVVDTPASMIPPLPSGEWRRSAAPEPVWSDSDPFTSPFIEARLAQEEADRAAEKARRAEEAKARATIEARTHEQQQAKTKAATPAGAVPTQKLSPPPASPKPPRTITLVYRGLLTRTDGTSVAIIEQIENGMTTLLKAGDRIEGFTMARLGRSTAILTTADGQTEHPLPVGNKTKLTPDEQK